MEMEFLNFKTSERQMETKLKEFVLIKTVSIELRVLRTVPNEILVVLLPTSAAVMLSFTEENHVVHRSVVTQAVVRTASKVPNS